jgi:hypothetical protein
MALFDNLDDPQKQAFLMAAAGLLQGQQGKANFGADLSRGLLSGLQGYNQGRAFYSREQDAKQAREMHAMQLAQMQRQGRAGAADRRSSSSVHVVGSASHAE